MQQSTIRKISDFFGVSYKEIETIDLEGREVIESTVSLYGNMNPAAVPVIKQNQLVQGMSKRIGELVTIYPLTYYFGTASNLIGVRLEADIDGLYDLGNLLIVKKGELNGEGETLVYNKATKRLFVVGGDYCERDSDLIVGSIIEERFNGL